jgi:hypothetical protein
MKKVLIGLVVGFVFFIAALYGVFFYTAVPLKIAKTIGEKFDIHTTGLSGNFARGFRLESLSYSDEYTDFKIQDVKFEYSGPWDTYVNHRFIYEAIEIGSAELNIKKMRGSVSKSTSKSTTQDSDSSPSTTEWGNLREKWAARDGIREFGIRNLHFKNMKVTASFLPMPLELQEYKVSNLIVQPNLGSVDEVKIVSTYFNFSLSGLTLDTAGIRMNQPAAITVKTAAWSGLKQDFSLKLDGSYDFTSKNYKADAVLFDGRLDAHLSGSDYLVGLATHDFTPGDFLTNAPPIQHMNVKTEPKPYMAYLMGGPGFEGDFTIGETQFTLSKDSMPFGGAMLSGMAEAGPLKYAALVRPKIVSVPGQPSPWIEIRTNQKTTLPEVLSQILFKKPFNEAIEAEKIAVTQASANYALGEPILPLYTPPGRPVKSRVRAPLRKRPSR